MTEEMDAAEIVAESSPTTSARRSVSFRSTVSDRHSVEETDDEVELQWAAIEKLPTFRRLRTSLFDNNKNNHGGKAVIDVSKLEALERQLIVDKLISHVEEDNRRLLSKMRQRMDRVGVKFPSVEVKFKNLCVEAECEVVHGKPLPTLWNTFESMFSVFTNIFDCKSQKAKLTIIKGVTGIIKPSRMTLLIGPPGSGKTSLLKALAGKLDSSLKVSGEIYYNGCRLENLMPQKTSAYISQYDLQIPEMTVRETIDFSARCQGVENRTEIMVEISQREKEAGIIPEPDIDTYMKAISISGLERSLQTDYTLKILGLDICADTIVGDPIRRGISGGQKRRLATGEMIVGPRRAFFMDEISNGLDSSTTFQMINCLQQLAHITDVTVLISLLQPAPETFDLFDDIILFAEGKIVYHGPRSSILNFFEDCGFRCPKRKGVAEFLQEVISKKDQQQYWYRTDIPHRYISVDDFFEKYKASHLGEQLYEELLKTTYDPQSQQNILSKSNDTKYSITKWELFKACWDREFLLMRRNSSVHIFKIAQLLITALITMTIFLRKRMDLDLKHANYYMGSLFYAIIRILLNGISELYITVSRLSVFYKQRDYSIYPAWAYSIPAFLLKIPVSLLESFLWTSVTYYVIGYSPEAERFFCQFLIYFGLHQAATSMFRFVASICQTDVIAVFSASIYSLIMFLSSGFIIPLPSLPSWLRWGFWTTPLSYAEIGVSLNEFLAPRWKKVSSNNLTIAQETLSSHGLNFKGYYYWISLGFLFGFTILANIGFTLALTYMKSPGRSLAIISHERLRQLQKGEDDIRSPIRAMPSTSEDTAKVARMILYFEPLTITFQHIQYSVDTPQEMREQGFTEKRLQLLHDITGAFKPGILTALMGVSGAGKTTLMDVLAGRKTSGYIEGSIRIGGFPKVQKTFARISGYCEQNDIHSPQITVEESLLFSAWLRLPSEIDKKTKEEFVKDVLGKIELDEIKDALVGIPGRSGLSYEQRKRLTIAVELVSNPSIIFMDEPTTGLDARAAAIVMRAVKNVVDTGRTVVCTIHQPSIDIFEAFDELILMKKGGQIIYSGPLGADSCKLIDYFEGIPGLPKIKENYNPATWMLEVTTPSLEEKLNLDFAQAFKESLLFRENLQLVEELSKPSLGSRNLQFSTVYPHNSWEQFKACLWKQNLSYWRSPTYNLTRLMFVIISSVILGLLMWQKGKKINNEQDTFNILSSTFIVLLVLAGNNSSSVIPVVAAERLVLYRENFSAMYSSWAYSFAQVAIELLYIFMQTVFFVIIAYPAVGFYWSTYKVVWFFYATFCTLLYYNNLGGLIMSISPNANVASILATASYTILNLFSGYLIPGPAIPKWWVWCYWISPTSWSLKGIITSQYGDIKQEILVFGEKKALNSFLEDYFGYHYDKLGSVAVVLAAYPLLFSYLFAVCTEKLNFQRR